MSCLFLAVWPATFAHTMNRQQLIEECSNLLADEMYRDMTSYISAHWDEVNCKTKDYTLMSVRRDVGEAVTLPEECKLELRGYEIVLQTPIPMFFRFGLGNFWIGPRLIVIRYKEEIVAWFPYLIDNILPGAIITWRERSASLERELLKSKRLKALETMYKETIKS